MVGKVFSVDYAHTELEGVCKNGSGGLSALMILLVCVCVCVCIFIHVHVPICVYIGVHSEVKGYLPLWLFALYFEIRSLTEPGAHGYS